MTKRYPRLGFKYLGRSIVSFVELKKPLGWDVKCLHKTPVACFPSSLHYSNVDDWEPETHIYETRISCVDVVCCSSFGCPVE